MAGAVFYIQEGRVKLVVESEQGKEAVVAILGAGEFFGEGCLIGQPLRLASARAMATSEVMRMGKSEMIRVFHAEPAFGEVFMAHLLTRNSRIEESAWSTVPVSHCSTSAALSRHVRYRPPARRLAREIAPAVEVHRDVHGLRGIADVVAPDTRASDH